MLRFNLLVLFFLFNCFLLQAQNKIQISGTIRDASTGETLIGASVYNLGSKDGVTSNEYGFFTLLLPLSNDSLSIEFSYIGYATQIKRLAPKTQSLEIELGNGAQIQEIVVSASANQQRVNSAQMGVAEVTAQEAKLVPAFLGEVDIIRVLQTKPGVLTGGEGQSGVFVRGGGPDQNLFILDEAPVYNPSHLFGFFSTFNSDAVKNAELFKSGFPAQYGGRLSSVIDVKLNEGNRKRFSASGGIGLISSRLTLEGPIIKDKLSFIVSGRRTYFDIFTNAYNGSLKDPSASRIPGYYFYDFNAKMNYDISPKDKLFVSGYLGRDQFNFANQNLAFNFGWGNKAFTARWNHLFSPQLFANTCFTFSDFDYLIDNRFDNFSFSFGSGIRDFNFKTDFSWRHSPQHYVRFGGNFIAHRFKVNNLSAATDDNTFNVTGGNTYTANDYAAYINDEWTVNEKLTLTGGLRLSGFSNGANYYGIEPRLAGKYSLTPNISVKANYSRMYQYIHLISSTGASLPTDVWFPSTKLVKPQYSDQFSVGGAFNLKNDWFFTVEGFYKLLNNQVDFKENANLFVNENLDNEFVFGKGRAYGTEVYLEKKPNSNGSAFIDKLSGWIGYTLSWSWRTFAELNNGLEFKPRYDRRHDLSLVLMYQISKRVTLSSSVAYNTGNAYSLPYGNALYLDAPVNGNINPALLGNPSAQAFSNINFAPIYTERNALRLPDYFRWDLGLVWKLFPRAKRFTGDLTFSVYNTTDQRNPFFMYFKPEDVNNDGRIDKVTPTVVSLFPVIPTVTFNFKF